MRYLGPEGKCTSTGTTSNLCWPCGSDLLTLCFAVVFVQQEQEYNRDLNK